MCIFFKLIFVSLSLESRSYHCVRRDALYATINRARAKCQYAYSSAMQLCDTTNVHI